MTPQNKKNSQGAADAGSCFCGRGRTEQGGLFGANKKCLLVSYHWERRLEEQELGIGQDGKG